MKGKKESNKKGNDKKRKQNVKKQQFGKKSKHLYQDNYLILFLNFIPKS